MVTKFMNYGPEREGFLRLIEEYHDTKITVLTDTNISHS